MERYELIAKTSAEMIMHQFDEAHDEKWNTHVDQLMNKSPEELVNDANELHSSSWSLFEELFNNPDLGKLAHVGERYADIDYDAYVTVLAFIGETAMADIYYHAINYVEDPGEDESSIAFELAISIRSTFEPGQTFYPRLDPNVRRQGSLAFLDIPRSGVEDYMGESHENNARYVADLAETHQTLHSIFVEADAAFPSDYSEPSVWPPDLKSLRE